MAEGKKSFVAYCEWQETFDMLTDEEAGRLAKHLFAYVNDENPDTDDRLLRIAFEPIKLQLKRDLRKYEEKCGKNRENAQKRWEKARNEKYERMQSYANECEAMRSDAKHADNDNDNDNDNDIIINYNNNNISIISNDIIVSEKISEVQEVEDIPKKEDKIPFAEIKKLWNDRCTDYPKLISMSEARKNKIRVRIEEMGGIEKAMPILNQLFDTMQTSKFLRGDNKNGWRASFDWLFENGKNWVKVYEGNYNNKQLAGSNIGPNATFNETNYKEF